jgi:hypothetical protein
MLAMKMKCKKVSETTVRLKIELVPTPLWGKTLARTSSDEWDVLRREVYKRVNYRCEICGGNGPRHPVECHEIWFYDDKRNIQELGGFMGICPACHSAKHYGRSSAHGNEEQVRIHLMKVNGWTENELARYVKVCYKVWRERSKRKWTQDFSWLDKWRMDHRTRDEL